MSVLIALLFLAFLPARADDTPVVQRDAPYEILPARQWDFTHLHLNLTIDPHEGTVWGTATHTVKPLAKAHNKVRLYQEHLDIEAVWVDQESVENFRVTDGLLDIPARPGVPHEIKVQYRAAPETGLHFRSPKGSADRILEVWSQGEGPDNRHWFPGWDYPNDRFTFSGTFTMPESLHLVSNGLLVGTQPAQPGWTQWQYEFKHELVNYLVMVAAGEYEVYKEDGVVPLEYLVAKGISREVALKSFGGAKPQLEFFNELLGTDYPYPVYRQIAVQRFMYGGMENTTSTIMADDLLRRFSHDTPYRAESVTAHELAHQWFGDYLTCYGWRELWLNEGFASYYAYRWMAHKFGAEYAAADLHGDLRAAISNDYPMSPTSLTKKGSAENSSVYTQGLAVLHGLAVFLGQEAFDQAIANYVDIHADRLVESADLRRVLEDTTGEPLGWMFDQWVTGHGTPSFTTSHTYEAPNGDTPGQLTVQIEQTTKEAPFYAPVDIEIGTGSGVLNRRVWVHKGLTKLVVDLDTAPRWVVVDPQGGLIAKWTRNAPVENWVNALQESPTPYARLIAMNAFGTKTTSTEAVVALSASLRSDRIHASLRRYAANALGRIRTEEAIAALIEALDDSDPYIRAKSLDSLENTPATPESERAMRKRLKDPIPWVQRAALSALDTHDADIGLNQARLILNRNVTAKNAVLFHEALSTLSRRGSVEDVDTVLRFTRPKTIGSIRKVALWNINRLINGLEDSEAKSVRPRVSRALEAGLSDPDIRVRQATIQALGYVGDSQAAKRLMAIAADTQLTSTRNRAYSAANQIRNRRPEKQDPEQKKTDLERIEAQIKELERRLENVERWR